MSIDIRVQSCILRRSLKGDAVLAEVQLFRNDELDHFIGSGETKEIAIQRALEFLLRVLGGEYSIGVDGDKITFDPTYTENLDDYDT